MNLTRLIFDLNSENTRSVCLTQGDDFYTYGDLFDMIGKVKVFLQKTVKQGDRVGLLCENGMGFVSAYLACLDSGVVVVPANTSFSEEDLEYITRNCGIKLFMCSEKIGKKMKLPVPAYAISDILRMQSPPATIWKKPAETDEHGLAALIHTSGSTGNPNAVMITHGNLLANTRSILSYLNMKADDKTMVVLPFYYCYGASLMHTTLCSGGQLVINNKFMFPQKVVNEICEKGCTIFAGVPSTYQIMLKYTKMRETDMSCLRMVLQAGGKLSNRHLLELRQALPGTDIIVMYGQTEATARLSYLPPEMFEPKLGSIGKGIPGVELMVVNDMGDEVSPKERGEIIAKGKSISPGYLNNEEETKDTFRNGWLYTGDIATVDEDGFIYIVDRKKDFVKVGGNRVSLTEIEETVTPSDRVSEAVAVGVPDEMLGEAVVLFVVPAADGLKPDQVLGMCKKQLPAYKVPKAVKIIDEIPRNAYGKVQRFLLLDHLDGIKTGEPKKIIRGVDTDG